MIHKADKDLKTTWLGIFQALDPEAKKALRAALLALREDALERAQYCWKKHKAPMALYWKVIGVYSGHLARALRPPKSKPAQKPDVNPAGEPYDYGDGTWMAGKEDM